MLNELGKFGGLRNRYAVLLPRSAELREDYERGLKMTRATKCDKCQQQFTCNSEDGDCKSEYVPEENEEVPFEFLSIETEE